MSSPTTDSEKFDPKRRRLCPDGACVGLLDDSGRCKVCGLTASGEAAPAEVAPLYDESPEAAESPDESTATDAVAASDDEPAGEASSGGFDPRRRLCPDGACVGVLGADGRCKVCGQAG
jgi:hypothetical protein